MFSYAITTYSQYNFHDGLLRLQKVIRFDRIIHMELSISQFFPRKSDSDWGEARLHMESNCVKEIYILTYFR